MRAAASLPGVLLAGVLLAGCAGYRLGPTGGQSAGARSIRVNPFQNQTGEPRLIEPLMTSLRRSLQQDGTFRLATREDADLVVNGVITRFERSPLSFERTDVITVQDYRLLMTARLTAVDRRTGQVMMDREVTGRTAIPVGSDLNSAERQALPLLAEDLARRATALLVDGGW
jgi:hypothetical protein